MDGLACAAGRCACDRLLARNPATAGMLGLCPMLAVSTSFAAAVALGVVTMLVMAIAGTAVSLTRRLVPEPVRLPFFMIAVSTVVTLADLLLARHFFALSERLGIFLPLVITNCVVLARMEICAYRSPPGKALADALWCGLGLTLAIAVLALVRTAFANGVPNFDLWLLTGGAPNHDAKGYWNLPFPLTPAGGFIAFGLLAACANSAARAAGFRPSAAGTAAPTN